MIETSPRAPAPLVSEPCCPETCHFRPDRMRLFLSIISSCVRLHAARCIQKEHSRCRLREAEDPVIQAKSILAPKGERHMGGAVGRPESSADCSAAEFIITVMDKLANGHRLSSVEKLAEACCPFATGEFNAQWWLR